MTEKPKRPRGRPASENLGRFYLSTGLLQHEKSMKLRRELAIDEPELYLLVSRLFDFVATYAGSSGHIKRASYSALASFCFWRGDPFLLVSAFRRAGFIDNEGDLHGWHEFQPDAAKRASRRFLKGSQVSEPETLGSVTEEAETITANLIPHNSNDPPRITENIIHQNSQETQVQEKQDSEILAQGLLSQNSESKSIEKSSYAPARASNFGGVIQDLKKMATAEPQLVLVLGKLAPLARIVFGWSGTSEPTAGDVAGLRLAAAQIGPDGVERLVRDFQERDYQPENKLAALFGAARSEYRSFAPESDSVATAAFANQTAKQRPSDTKDTEEGT